VTGTLVGPDERERTRPPSFVLPAELEASVPPEARGITRDAVRMMVGYRHDSSLVHTTFSELPRFLGEGDLVVINTSGTLPASVAGVHPDGEAIEVHFSTRLPAGLWTVELRRAGQPELHASAGQIVELPEAATVTLLTPYSENSGGVRLWVATVQTPQPLLSYLTVHGRPIAYSYVRGSWPISTYQNVYATHPGSAEMPSAGRPFTSEVLMRLVTRGVGVVPVVLHTGVASLEAWEPPYPEYFEVSSAAAHRVNDTRHRGGRVVAVGTTVVRALETVVDDHGRVNAGSGWTETVVTSDRHVASVDGLLTGWHEPDASHLAMLEAISGRELLERSYAVALEQGYLWHEFGDVHLVLP
jgi:S-adenosylmethionine:tRNA ribosyltransferase-isomerase